MLNYIPLLGWALSFVFSTAIAVPFYFLWNHLAPIYLSWLPMVYQSLPFWDCVWFFMLFSILKIAMVPKLIDVNTSK